MEVKDKKEFFKQAMENLPKKHVVCQIIITDSDDEKGCNYNSHVDINGSSAQIMAMLKVFKEIEEQIFKENPELLMMSLLETLSKGKELHKKLEDLDDE